MTDAPAPFHHASADAPAAAHAVWLRADDGVRLRAGVLGAGEKGTILLIPGRTEYLEKYGRAAREFAARGYGLAALDYRGQGLADRLLADPAVGHVVRFSDYQRDVAAFVAFAARMNLPRPWFVAGHSLGGAIALRAVREGLDARAALFSAPMWGINMASALRPVAWGLGWVAHRTAMNWWVTPGTSRATYVRKADPDDNFLTSDPAMLHWMRAQLDATPGLDLGGPSVPWLYRALVECRGLARIDDPGMPSLTVLPTRDEIVSLGPMRDLPARWPDAELLVIEDGRHETMMETADRQRLFFDTSAAFFDTHRLRHAA